MQLKPHILATIRNHKKIKNRLALELDKSSYTIERWISENNEQLTLAASLKIIKEELELTDSAILEEEVVKGG